MNAELVPQAKHFLAASRVAQQFAVLETILVVEDETFIREIACEILESAGYRVLKARNPAEARTVFRDHRKTIQLLVSDFMLPGGNGRDLARELRIINPALRVLLISGYPENVVAQKGVAKDLCFYLQKPFSAESLLRKIWHVSAKDLDECAI